MNMMMKVAMSFMLIKKGKFSQFHPDWASEK